MIQPEGNWTKGTRLLAPEAAGSFALYSANMSAYHVPGSLPSHSSLFPEKRAMKGGHTTAHYPAESGMTTSTKKVTTQFAAGPSKNTNKSKGWKAQFIPSRLPQSMPAKVSGI